MLDVALRKADGTVTVDPALLRPGGRGAPPLPVHPALRRVLPDGLRRGSTVGVGGSLSLLFALLGAASADGAWCALVGFPPVSAEALAEYGVDLGRVAIVPAPGAGWTTAVGALLDAVDIVAARPPARIVPGDVRRLAARVRTRDAVLVPYLTGGETWPGADVRLQATDGTWVGIGSGTGRLRARRLRVQAEGRGGAARPRRAELWLPAAAGAGVADVDAVAAPGLVAAPSVVPATAPVIELAG
ncbi:MAG: hypothetical protein ACTHMS_20170 [Jatrophihabitans sp.]|uniref:hypothetical protein n=1 Tax=Jatrophihabitans sp. TaxID=1932789 RepID=UPI003F7EB652